MIAFPATDLFLSFAVLFDPGWFDVMRDNIARNKPTPEAYILAFGFFGLFILWIVLGLLIKIEFRKKELPEPGVIDDRREIAAILSQGARQRGKVRVAFQREEKSGYATDAAFIDASRAGVVLDLTSVTSLSPQWIGKRVECDFRLKTDPKADVWSFYGFTAAIADLAMTPEGYVRLTAATPARLRQEQKRSHLRIEPPLSFFLGCRFWREDLVRARGRLDDPGSWGPPILALAAEDPGHFDVQDISAGGMRLDMKAETFKPVRRAFEPGGRFLVVLDLFDPEVPGGRRFYLRAALQNVYGAPDEPGERSFGLRFTAHGKADDKPPHLVTFASVQTGASDLDDWVYARHLDMYRGKGL